MCMHTHTGKDRQTDTNIHTRAHQLIVDMNKPNIYQKLKRKQELKFNKIKAIFYIKKLIVGPNKTYLSLYMGEEILFMKKKQKQKKNKGLGYHTLDLE